MAEERIWELMARKLAGEASTEELEELDQQLRTHPNLHLSLQAVADLWQRPAEGTTNANETLHAAYQQHIERMRQMGISIQQAEENPWLLEGAQKRDRTRTTWLIAASLLLIGAAAWFFYQPASTTPRAQAMVHAPLSEITTKNGSKTRIQLPDGTQVWLNAGSKLTYEKNFGNTLREVTLIGEGFFDVVRNEHKPFIIHTAKMDVKVLGTRFNVKSYPNDKTTEAALIHGSIEVTLHDRPVEKIILKPNEKIVVANTDTAASSPINTTTTVHPEHESKVAIKNLTYQHSDSAIAETSWVDNKLIFVDESFADLALQMERWYGITIQITHKKLEKLRFTGVFKEETIEEAMRALKITAHFNYTIHGKSITITR